MDFCRVLHIFITLQVLLFDFQPFFPTLAPIQGYEELEKTESSLPDPEGNPSSTKRDDSEFLVEGMGEMNFSLGWAGGKFQSSP